MEFFKVAICDLKDQRGQHRQYLPLAITEARRDCGRHDREPPRATEASVYVVRALVPCEPWLPRPRHRQSVQHIRSLMAPPEPKRRSMAFVIPDEKKYG